MCKRATFLGELNPNGGYGQHSAAVIDALQSRGYFVSIRPFHSHVQTPAAMQRLYVHCPQPEPWELILSPPHRPLTPDKRTVYYTMWESTRLPPHCVDTLNNCEHVIVPTQWNADTFRESGVNRHIWTVPLGFNPAVYGYREVPKGKHIVFGAGGNLWNGAIRKGVGDVVTAFKAAFPNNHRARLWLKITGNLDTGNDPRIRVFDKPMTESEMSWWYGHLNCFVSCARAEGWGLMQMQAMAVGRPVIGAAYAGLAEFLNEDVGYPVFYRVGPAKEVWAGHGDWAEPNIDHVIHLMRRVNESPEDCAALGEKAAESVAKFTWENSTTQLIEILEKLWQS